MGNEMIDPRREISQTEEERERTQLGQMIQEVLSPVLEAMAKFMQNNTEALERLSAAQKMQSDRMEALERQIRLNTLVTPAQVMLLAAAESSPSGTLTA